MKYVLIICLIITASFGTPSWYYKLKPSSKNTYIGFGSGINEIEARQNALVSVSSLISTKIDNETIKNTKNIAGVYKKDVEIKSSQKTNNFINGYKVLKVEESDGLYYVAVEYENISSLDKFVNKLKIYNISKDEEQNSYLKNTRLNYLLKKQLTFNINFSIYRKDEKWYIKYKDILQVLDYKDFSNLFTTLSNKNISLTTNKKNNLLFEGNEFYFKVKSKSKGYVSILSVYEDGTVSSLFKNIPIRKNKNKNIPNKDYESILEAGLIEADKETYDLYVVLFTKQRVVFDNFTTADNELITDERYKNFDELVEYLDKKTYSSLKVVTKP